MSGRRRLLLVTPNFDNNSLGRTYCLWLLARHLGWSTEVVGVMGRRLWEPLEGSEFSQDCLVLTGRERPARDAELRSLVSACDVVVAVKPLPSSLGLVAPLAAGADRPLLVDVDDPDLEVRSTLRPLVRRARPRTTWGRRREVGRLAALVEEHRTIVSNPVLQERYGGLVVPHVRPQVAPGKHRESRDVVVRFVGSPRGHKGLDVLRAAVAVHAGEVRLEVTATAPPDAQPWETWLGETTLDHGQELVASADVVALPSLAEGYALAQLPAKLMDAMVHGRAVVASALPPIAWALQGAGLLVPPGDVAVLARALGELRDPSRRRSLGDAAYRVANDRFTVAAVAPSFEHYVDEVVREHQAGRTQAVPAGTRAREERRRRP